MCTSKLKGSFDVRACAVLILTAVLECERDLEYLESLGLGGRLKKKAFL